jgi:hypothetical protein
MKPILLTTLVLAWAILSCDEGLAPRSDNLAIQTGIAGTVLFENWPAPDSLVDLRLVAFRTFPPENIFVEVISGQAFAYPAIGDTTRIPLYVDQYDFQFELPAGEYGYLVVAQQYGDDLFSDWRAVGQYDLDSDSLPSPLEVIENQVTRNIIIGVDFNNLPIQPF